MIVSDCDVDRWVILQIQINPSDLFADHLYRMWTG